MNLSVEHVLLFLVIVFFIYHLIGNCSCSGNGFSVGGQSASPTCKCKYTDCYIPNKQRTSSNVCVSAKNVHDCTCDDKSSPSSCNSGKSWERLAACAWTNCNSITSSIDGDNLTYNFDLRVLKLDPTNGAVIYEFQNNGWSNTANGNEDPFTPLSDTQVGVLNCLQNQLNIRYIGVNNKGSAWYKYQILAGIQSGKRGADFTFSGPGVDEESFSIDITSTPIHDVNYNAQKPTITKLIVKQ